MNSESNEELVLRFQNGDEDALAQLWKQVRGFCARKAQSLIRALDPRRGIEFDDLISAAYIAVHDAAQTYKPGAANYLTWLSFYLKTEFGAACGWRTSKMDALNYATSLDTPTNPDDEDSSTYMNLIPDSRHDIEDAEERIYNEQLHNALNAVIVCLPNNAAECIQKLYLEDIQPEQYAEQIGISVTQLSKRKHNYLYQLKIRAIKTPEGKELRRFIEDSTPYYLHVGVSRFNTTSMSAVEEAVFMRDKLEQTVHKQ